ncbi:MAG: hypothetical protein GY765_02685 [bacterium]|nr:hypothetical protein [bacterium]
MGFEIQSIGNRAVENTLKENRQKGIPIVFSKNGVVYYELPDGTITTESPFKRENRESESHEQKTDQQD